MRDPRIRCDGVEVTLSVEDYKTTSGRAGLHMVAGLPLLRPEEQVFAPMLNGWAASN